MIKAQSPQSIISPNEVLIYNQSYMDILVHVSFKNNKWKKQRMDAEEWMILKLKGKNSLLKVSTPGLAPSTVLFHLEGGKKYDIFWYASKRRLDIAEFKDTHN